MRGRIRVWSLTVVLTIAPAAVSAVDLNGKWFFEGSGSGTIVLVNQTGSALSIPWLVPFTGTVGATDANGFTGYSVFWTDGTNQAGFGGRIMPSDNLFDGQGGFFFPPNFPGLFGVIATRCTCDDDNTADGDGCSAECQVEPCWTCVGDPSVCTPTPDSGACDDGSPCTTGETCSSGVCGAGTPVVPCFDINGPWTRHFFVPDLDIESHTATIIRQRGTDLRIDSYVGTIDPVTGVFDVRSANLYLFCGGFDPLPGSVAADGLTYNGTGSVGQLDPFAPDVCLYYAATELGDHCGDGDFDGVEACDDGNLVAGDGCSPLCEVEQCWSCGGTPSSCTPVGGGSCDDGNPCTITDTCAGDGSCAGTPDTGASCDDGDICTAPDTCASDGSCNGSPVDCGECYTCNVSLGCMVDAGGSCDDGDPCTAGDVCYGDATCAGGPQTCEPCFACDGNGGCLAEPQPVCKVSTAPDKSIVFLKNDTGDTKDRFSWRWNKGADTSPSELGIPPSGDDVTVCVYDESTATTALLFRATIPGNTSWTPTSTGFVFHDDTAGGEGVSLAQLKSGAAGKAKAKVKGKGVHLSDRPYGLPAPALPLPLRVQLQGENGLCLETRHDATGVLTNDASRGVFRARGVP